MNFYTHKTLWKMILLALAAAIGFTSLLYTNSLVKKLKAEERKKVELWARATRQIISSPEQGKNLDFVYSITEDNTTVPVILTDGNDSIISAVNFDHSRTGDRKYLRTRLEKMKGKTEPIVIDFGDGYINRIYYRDSTILTKLIYYPYVQLSVIIMFILVSYVAFSSSRKAEQNQVWVGMSKETAHQLGTPTSSLAGWVEILQMKHPEVGLAAEMARDVARLEKVTERFSKIGARPDIAGEDIIAIIQQTIEYLRSRSSSKMTFTLDPVDHSIIVPVNAALFSWVIENICKNAIDATEGTGMITLKIIEAADHAVIDVSDTGKGMPKSSFKKIFRPGFTTKERGWGLGLSLAKRIIEEYHNGRIFVRYSEPGRGTCIRIVLKKLAR
ncbi:MAG TPA: HAMP domain-containing sensor histidine kinase [Bacteroidales bacterium]|nr:HAMP domain-containing sensor histidine kinase [Bacteroidales bacterium]